MLQNREAAHHWAVLGFRIFPVYSKGPRIKQPCIKDWQNQATTDPKRIEDWWKQFPDAAVGLPCGQENGLTVADCDPDPSEGRKLWESELAKYFPNWRSSPRSRTPSGGIHLFFGYKEGLKNRTKVLPSIDVRTEGGYVLAPLCESEAGTYEWALEPDLELSILPEMPEKLFQALSKPARSKGDSVRQNVPLENSAYGNAALKRELDTLRQTADGGRNDALNRAVFCLGQLVKSGDLNESEVRLELELAAW